MSAQAVQTHAAEQTANTDPNKGAVDISAENAQMSLMHQQLIPSLMCQRIK